MSTKATGRPPPVGFGELAMAAQVAPPAADDPMKERTTLAQAVAEGRCACEGCGACRGQRGYPCSMLREGLCTWCAAERRRG